MRFLGEPERYLEAAILPVAFLTSFFLFERHSSILWTFFIAVVIYAFSMVLIIFSDARHNKLWNSDQEELVEWLRKIKTSRILTIPLKAVCFLVYRTQHQGLSILTNISEESQQKRFRELCPILYPLPNANLERLAKDYNLDIIIAHRPTIDRLSSSGLGIRYDFSRFQIRYENRSFVVYGVGENL
jgi:hypothetical protein